jgi:hypothetical protein
MKVWIYNWLQADFDVPRYFYIEKDMKVAYDPTSKRMYLSSRSETSGLVQVTAPPEVEEAIQLFIDTNWLT